MGGRTTTQLIPSALGTQQPANLWNHTNALPRVSHLPHLQAPPVKPDTSRLKPLSPQLLSWFASRGIGAATLRRNGVAMERRYINALEDHADCIAFPYRQVCPLDGLLASAGAAGCLHAWCVGAWRWGGAASTCMQSKTAPVSFRQVALRAMVCCEGMWHRHIGLVGLHASPSPVLSSKWWPASAPKLMLVPRPPPLAGQVVSVHTPCRLSPYVTPPHAISHRTMR